MSEIIHDLRAMMEAKRQKDEQIRYAWIYVATLIAMLALGMYIGMAMK